MNIKFILEAEISANPLEASDDTFTMTIAPYIIGIETFDHYPSEAEILQSAKDWILDNNSTAFRINWLQVQKRYFVGGEV